MLLFCYTKPIPDAYSTYIEKLINNKVYLTEFWEEVNVGEQATLHSRQLSRYVVSSKLAAWSLECVL